MKPGPALSPPVAVLATGMVTGVGSSAAATCAALRCAMAHFVETRFRDQAGEWIRGSTVILDKPWQGRAKLIHLVAPAISECLVEAANIRTEEIPLILCLPEMDRPGRLEGLDESLLADVGRALNHQFHPQSTIICRGRVAGADAVLRARKLIHEAGRPFCIVAGVDSYLITSTLHAYEEQNRLLTSENSNGFLPGEGGTAVLLGPAKRHAGPELLCLGIGFGQEKATVNSEEPLRGDGLSEAVRKACAEGGRGLQDVNYRLADLSGEQYGFKEAALAISRTVRVLKPEFDIWHPGGFLGELGAAIGPCVLGVALTAARKGYAPGDGVLCHFSNDDGARAAMILRYDEVRAA